MYALIVLASSPHLSRHIQGITCGVPAAAHTQAPAQQHNSAAATVERILKALSVVTEGLTLKALIT
jgi:hypothetical protein